VTPKDVSLRAKENSPRRKPWATASERSEPRDGAKRWVHASASVSDTVTAWNLLRMLP